MPTLNDYVLGERLFGSSEIVVHAARGLDGASVLLCLQHREAEGLPPWQEAGCASGRTAAALLGQPALVMLDDSQAIVVADLGLRPLALAVERLPLKLAQALHVAIGVARALGEIHDSGQFHGLLNDETTWVSAGLSNVQLLALGPTYPDPLGDRWPIDLFLARQRPGYIAPEQTGRMDYLVDRRADLYALGVLIYRLVTGILPFASSDPHDVIHGHIAAPPIAPREVNPQIPDAVSAIILRLLAKSPEDRYQTARGVAADVHECLRRLGAEGSIASFPLGRHDAAPGLVLPARLYDREPQIAAMRRILERAAAGTAQILFVSGPPGIGKTSLIAQLAAPVQGGGGFFVGGKFDQYNQNIPYAPLTRALNNLVHRILGLDANLVEAWRDRLRSVLGPNARIVQEVVPDLIHLLGPSAPVQPLPPVEARNRFNRVIGHFIRAFAAPGCTLCIMLDDMQWADLATIDLVEMLASEPYSRHLIIVGAFRSTEIDPTHPVSIAIARLKDANASVHEFGLQGLSVVSIRDFVCDLFECRGDEAAGLAELLHSKTDGNPFFIIQLVRLLLEKGLASFDFTSGRWRWSLDEVRAHAVSNDVAELVASKLARLAEATRAVLSTAACLGSDFDPGALAMVTGQRPGEVSAALDEALQHGVIVESRSAEHTPPTTQPGPAVAARYRFLHDRVQQAAFALISDRDKPALHLAVGRSLLPRLQESPEPDVLFTILNNLNSGAALIKDAGERLEVACLNLKAGRRARESLAFTDALSYLRAGLDLLPDNAWSADYRLAFDLHTETFRCAYQAGEFDGAERLFAVVMGRAREPLEKADLMYTRILLHTGAERYQDAIRVGGEALALLGVRFTPKASRLALAREFLTVKMLMRGRQVEELADLPEMTDPNRRMALKILMSLLPPAYFLDPNLLMLIGTQIVTMSLRHGNSPESASGYVLFGLGLGAALGRYQAGYAFGRLAVNLSTRYADISVRAKTLVIFGGFVNFWCRPVESSLEILDEAYTTAVNAGDYQYANYAVLASIFLQFAQGTRLDRFVAICNRYEPFVEHTRDTFAIDGMSFYRRAALSLQAAAGPEARLLSTGATEDQLIDRLLQSRNLTTIGYFYVVRLMLEQLLGNHVAALAYARKAEPYIRSMPGQIQVAEHCFYGALAAAELLGTGHPGARRMRRLIHRSARQMRVWAQHCPANFEPHALLLEAEAARVGGQLREAVELYDRAILAARERDLSNIAAIACERAADACSALRYQRLMRTYLFEARHFHSRWGAVAKVREIERRGGTIMAAEAVSPEREGAGPLQGERQTPAPTHLDAEIIGDIAQAVSGGLDETRLLSRMMNLALRHSGAARGWFISSADDRYTIEAEASLAGVDIFFPLGRPLVEAPRISSEILNLTARTKREVVISDARADPRLAHSAITRERTLRSLLCVPVLKQREVVGLLYLENDLAPGIFTTNRLRVTQMIAAELAIVIERNRIYRDLTEKNLALRTALEKLEMLSNIKTQLAKFVPHSVERIIQENPMSPAFEFRYEDVSVLFLDIEGYTRLTEALPHEDMNYLVERYFSAFLDDVNQNGGDVSATAGDGLVIVFQDADPHRHAERAVSAAICMRANTARLNRELAAKYPSLTINIGVNSGRASMGPTRIEGATGARWSYSAWGSVTNVAARIGAFASGGDILISEDTYARVAGQFRLEGLGAQPFKNVSRPVAVYRVLDDEPQPVAFAAVEPV